jgi:hypothetical protein
MKPVLLAIAITSALAAPAFAQSPVAAKVPETGGTLTGPLVVPQLNTVLYADQEPGATPDIRINRCHADLIAKDGGICDLTGFSTSTPLTLAATVSFGGNGVKEVFRCNPATVWQPGTATMTMFNVGADGTLEGCQIDVSNLPFTGNAVLVNTTVSDGSSLTLRDLVILNGTGYDTRHNQGNAIAIQSDNPSGSQAIAFVRVHHIRTIGFLNAIDLDDSVGTGKASGQWINGNIFDDIEARNAVDCITLNTGRQNIAGDTIDGNIFDKIQCEAGPASVNWLNATGSASMGIGASQIAFNRGTNMQAWDGGAVVMQSAATYNNFAGMQIGIAPPPTAGPGNVLSDSSYYQRKVFPNLLPDTDFRSGFTFWSRPAPAWSVTPGAGCNGTAGIAEGSADSRAFHSTLSLPVAVVVGQTYSVTACIDASHITGGSPNMNVLAYPEGTNLGNFYVHPGYNNRVFVKFRVPAGTSQVQVNFNSGGAVLSKSNTLVFSAPMMQWSNSPTNYVAGYAPSLTYYQGSSGNQEQSAPAHIVAIAGTLSGGSKAWAFDEAAQFSSATSYTCAVSDTTSISSGVRPLRNSGSRVTFQGTGNDTFEGFCIGH